MHQIPGEITATVDVRNPSFFTADQVHAMLDEWCASAGPNITYYLLDKICPPRPNTFIDTAVSCVHPPSAKRKCDAQEHTKDKEVEGNVADKVEGKVADKVEGKEVHVGPSGGEYTTAQRLWCTVCETLAAMGCPYKAEVFQGATDGRHLREVGVPVVGFSPIRHSPMLLHTHDECLSVEQFLEGIRIYQHIIPALANML